jgi:hypothetical protein
MTETDNRLKRTEVRLEKTEVRLFCLLSSLIYPLSVFCSLSSPVYSLTSDFCLLSSWGLDDLSR